MSRLTRRERFGLIALIILCMLVIGGLAFWRPTPSAQPVIPARTIEAENQRTDESETSEPIERHKPPKPHKKYTKEKAKKGTPAPRRHLDEPF